jgi:hypothetical protein
MGTRTLGNEKMEELSRIAYDYLGKNRLGIGIGKR